MEETRWVVVGSAKKYLNPRASRMGCVLGASESCLERLLVVLSDKLKRDTIKALTLIEVKKRIHEEVFFDKLLQFMVEVSMDEQHDAYERAIVEGLITARQWTEVFSRKYRQENGSNAFLAYVAAKYRHEGEENAQFLVLKTDPLYPDRVDLQRRFKLKIVTIEEVFGGR